MAYRVEIGEIVENATGLNITGATVTVRYHGGANAPVYDAENGGALVTQPLTTVNGKIGADYPSGAWVAEGDYDLDVTFGGDTLTFFWPARRGTQFVTTLPAGAGTSAPEDGELAIELYDGTNMGAWLRRYRAATLAWDMVGGPPPAGGALPGSPRTRQEFYLTGATPPVQHLRYNGASWDYVGTPPTVPVTGSPFNILDVGQANQRRAGRQLTIADVNTLAALPTTPVGLFNLGDTSNLGTGGALTNKGSVTFTTGIEGVSNAAAQFTGNTGQALWIADTGAADPFRIKTGMFSCWFKTAKRGVSQCLLAKRSLAGPLLGYELFVGSTNVVGTWATIDGTTIVQIIGTTDVADDRWHHAAVIADGGSLRLYVDGVPEASAVLVGALFGPAAPFVIGLEPSDTTLTVAGTLPHFGRIDEVLVIPDVPTEDQLRLFYAVKVPHGYATTPTRAALSVRRKRRGAIWVNADFPSQPARYYDGGTLTDKGTNARNLTANAGPTIVAGPDGASAGAYNFVVASAQYLSADDTGMSTGNMTWGGWLKTSDNSATVLTLLGYGTASASNERLIYWTNGQVHMYDVTTDLTGTYIADDQWHLIVAQYDTGAADGLKHKLYVDGRLVASSITAPAAVTLAGANGFRVGRRAAAGTGHAGGQIGSTFHTSTIFTQEQIAALYQKSSQALAGSPKEEGAHIEAFDTTNVYWVADTLDTNYAVDLAVAS